MITTSLDVLYISLAIGFLVFVIFACIAIFYLILILRDVTKVVDNVQELVDRVHKTIVQPLRAIDYIVERATPFIETIVERKVKSRTKAKAKPKSTSKKK